MTYQQKSLNASRSRSHVPSEDTQAPAQTSQQPESAGHNFAEMSVYPKDLRPSSQGKPLPAPVATKMQSFFQQDLSTVRVHEDSHSAKIGARAFTRGEHLHFAPGEYQPHTSAGQRLLGHELSHVVQQRVRRVAAPSGDGTPINNSHALESEADSIGQRAATHTAQSAETSIKPAAPPTTGRDPLQAVWKTNPSDMTCYWESRSPAAPTTPPPSGYIVVPAPALQHMEDVHQSRQGGSMSVQRSAENTPLEDLNILAHLASQASNQKGLFYGGPLQVKGRGSLPVLGKIPKREKGAHTKAFYKDTKERSATKYQEKLGTAEPGTPYEITHGKGHGQTGAASQTSENLASASHGANTVMMEPDASVTGNTNVNVTTHFLVRPGTSRAEQIVQSFEHKDRPGDPFFTQRIDGDLPAPTKSQTREQREYFRGRHEPEKLDASATLANFSDAAYRQPQALAHGFQSDEETDDDDRLVHDDEFASATLANFSDPMYRQPQALAHGFQSDEEADDDDRLVHDDEFLDDDRLVDMDSGSEVEDDY
jgi:hypothetical protein